MKTIKTKKRFHYVSLLSRKSLSELKSKVGEFVGTQIDDIENYAIGPSPRRSLPL